MISKFFPSTSNHYLKSQP